MVIPTGFSQVNIRFRGTAIPNRAEITFGVDNTAGGKTPSVIADAVNLAYGQNIAPNLCNTIGVKEVLVKNGPNDTGPFHIKTSGVEGNSSAQALPPNTSVLINKTTVHGGRRGRGRIYQPGYPETVVSAGGVLDAGAVLSYNTDWQGFLDDLETAEIPMVLLHGETVVAGPYEVQELQVQSTVATQKRRLRR